MSLVWMQPVGVGDSRPCKVCDFGGLVARRHLHLEYTGLVRVCGVGLAWQAVEVRQFCHLLAATLTFMHWLVGCAALVPAHVRVGGCHLSTSGRAHAPRLVMLALVGCMPV